MSTVDKNVTKTVLSGETLEEHVVFGEVIVSSGGIADEMIISGGNAVIYGEANDTVVNANGVISVGSRGGEIAAVTEEKLPEGEETAPVYAGGVVNRTAVDELGTLNVLSGGTANDTTVSGLQAEMYVSGGTANNTTVNANGTVVVNNNAVAAGAVVAGGAMYVHDANVNDVKVSGGVFAAYSGAIVSETTVFSGGSASVNFGGKAVDTVISSGGEISVTFNGIASNVVLHSGGALTLGGNQNIYYDAATSDYIPGGTKTDNGVTGGILTGTITISNGAVINAESGAMIDLVVAECTDESYLVNNLSAIKGDSTCYITVKADAADGEYKLAQNAASYSGSFMIGVNCDYNYYTAIEINQVISDKYVLRQDAAGNLVLKIGSVSANETPVISVGTTNRGNDIVVENGVTKNDVLAQSVFVSATGGVYANQYKIGNGSWKNYTLGTSVEIKTNTVVYFRSSDAEGYFNESSVEISNIDRVKPTISVSGPVGGAHNQITLTVTAADNRTEDTNVLTIQYYDGANWVDLAGNTYEIYSNGSYLFRAKDSAGNISEVTEWVVDNYDIVGPDSPELFYEVTDANGVTPEAAYGGTSAKKVVVTARGADDVVRMTYSVGTYDETISDYIWTEYTQYNGGVTFDAAGKYQVRFLAYDEAGNPSNGNCYSHFVVIDTAAPDAPTFSYTITDVTGDHVESSYDGFSATKVGINAAGAADVVRIEYSADGGTTWTVYNGTIDVIAPEKYLFKAVDAAGNDSDIVEVDLTGVIDRVAPAKPVATVGAKNEEGKVPVAATFEEGTQGYYRTASGTVGKCGTAPVKLSNTGWVEFWSVDNAGNTSEVLRVNVDLTAPATPVLSSVSRTEMGNQSVFVKADFSDEEGVIKLYRIIYDGEEAGEWMTYDAEIGAELKKNGKVQFLAKEIITDTDPNDNISYFEYENFSGIIEHTVSNIDITPPNAPVAKASRDNSDTANVPVSVMAIFDELSSRNEYSIDGGTTWKEYTKAVTFTQNGSVIFRSWDEYGNFIDTEYVVSNIDITPPEAPIVSADIVDPTTENVTVTAAFDEKAFRNEYSLDGVKWTVYDEDAAFTYTFDDNGTIYFRSWDEYGNKVETSYTVDNIDRVAPALPVVSKDVTVMTNGNVVVTADFADDSVKNEYSLDGGATWTEYNAETGVVFEKNGSVIFRTEDALGNFDVTTPVDVNNIDKEPPVISDVAADITEPVNGNVVVRAAFSADAFLKQYSLDGGATWLEYNAETGVLFEENGSVIFRAEDVLGNAVESDTVVVDNIDKVTPVAPMVYVDTRKPAQQVNITASHAEGDAVTIQYKYEGETEWRNYDGAFAVSENNTLIFSAVDAAGNRCDEVHYVIDNIDNVKPVITSAEANVTAPTKESVVVTAVCDDAEATIKYFIEGVTEDWQIYDPAAGVVVTNNCTVQFKAVDAVGNESELIYEHTVSNIDIEKPAAPVASADITAVTNKDVVITAAGADAADAVTIWFKREGETEWQLYNAETGVVCTKNETVWFRSEDAVGNISEEVTEVVVNNIDKTAPDAPYVNADITYPTNGKVTISAVFAADSVKNECSINGRDWVEYKTDIVFSTNGTVSFRSWDEAGNVSEETVYIVGNIDKTAPIAPVAAADVTEMTNGKVVVSATFADDSIKNEYSLDGKEWKLYLNGITFDTNGTVYFRSTDIAGNESEICEFNVNNIDITAPEIVDITASETAATNKDVTIVAISNDADAKIYYFIEGKSTDWELYDGGVVVTENGKVQFKAIDAVGNESLIVRDFEVTNIDKVKPAAPVASADIIDPTQKNVVVSATFAEDAARNEYSVDGGKSWVEYTAGYEFTDIGTIIFRSWDEAGNVSDEVTYVVNYIDREAPAVPVAVADVTEATNGNVVVTATFAEDSFISEYSLDGKEWNLYVDGITFAQNGVVYFRSTDNAGNVSEICEFKVNNIDKTAPEILEITLSETAATNKDVTVTATCDDADAAIYYFIEGKSTEWTLYEGGVVLTKNGKVQFKAFDALGNESEVIKDIEVTNIDKEKPAAPEAVADITAPTNQNVVVSATFAADSVLNECSINGKDWVEYKGSITFSQNGTVIFRSTDAAGNVSEEFTYVVDCIDKVAPDAPVVVADKTAPTSGNVILMANFAEDSVRREYSINGEEWRICAGSILITENCTVAFRSIDAASNISAETIYEVTNIDRTAPEAPVASANIIDPTKGNVIVSAEFAADSVKNEYSVDGGKNWNEYTAGYEFTDNGTILFRSTDAAGNVSETAFNVDNIDRVAPAAPIVSADFTEATNQDVTVSVVFAHDSVLNECSINGKEWVEYKGKITFSQNGTVAFRSTDAAGNSSVATYVVDNIDKVAPEIVDAASDITVPTVENVTVTVVSNDAEAKIQYFIEGKSSEWSDYADGVVMSDNGVIKFRAVDAAGNVGNEFTYEVSNIDRVAPDAPVAIADVTGKTNKDVTVSAEFAADSVKNEYSLDGGVTWLVYEGGITFVENGEIRFRSTDFAGNVSAEEIYAVDYIDRVAPGAPIVSADITAATNQNVTVSAQFVANYKNEYSVDGGEWQAYTAGVVFEKNGSITFRSWDEAGNYADTFYTVTNIDKEAPLDPEVSADITTATKGVVTVSAAFAADSVKNEYSINGGAWQAYTSGVVFDKNGIVAFRSTDAAGNISREVSYTVNNIDTDAPGAPVVSADVTELTNGNVTVSAEFAADSVKNEYSLDGQTWVLYDAAGVVFEQNGVVIFRSTDAVGNTVESSYIVSNIDKVAPDAPVVVADITAATNKDVRLTVTFAADAVKKEYSVDGSEWLDCTGSILVAANGTYIFRATDAAGNVSDEVTYVVSNIDKVAPDAPVASADITDESRQSVVVSAAFAADSVKNEYSLDGGATWQVYESAVVMTANGAITFRSTDAVGNVSTTVYNVGNIDRIAPDAPVVSADITAATNQNVTVSAVFAADSVKNEYSIDGGAWQTYTDAVVMTANGLVAFRSTDAAGNVSSETAYTVDYIDKVAPTAPIAVASTASMTNKSVLVNAVFAADSAKNEYSIDGGEWQTYKGVIVMTDNGTIVFRSTDAVGNASETMYTVDNIDKVAPDAPVAFADITEETNKNVSVSAVFAADSVKNEYSVDGGIWQKYTSAVVMISNGTITFRSTDAVGNTSESTYTVDNIDKVAPDAPTAFADITDWTTENVIVKAAFADGTARNEYSFDGINWSKYISEGLMFNTNGTVQFRSLDAAGNISSVTTYEVSNIDRTSPTLTISGVPSAVVYESVTVTASAADDASGIKSIEYSLDNKTWYTGSSVTVSSNGTVYFRATDNAGNVFATSANIDKISEKPNRPDSDLLSNGTSQIVGYDAESGKVGFTAVDGNVSPSWRGVWDWDGAEAGMWKVAGVGRFAGSTVENDGILLKNSANNTFAAWTDLGIGSYGYVNLGYVDGNFDAVCMVNLGGNSAFDDIIVGNNQGSYGIMLDGVEYHDIWNASSPELNIWQIEGSGKFGSDDEQLVMTNKVDGNVYLWKNLDSTFATWSWQQFAVGSLGSDWEVAAIGDFEGDGIDDIMVVEKSTNNVWVWDDGNAETKRWRGTMGDGFKIEAVGDYNGDGKDDLLLREYNTGWGGMGYWGAGYAGNWSDLNARIETDLESKFAIVS